MSSHVQYFDMTKYAVIVNNKHNGKFIIENYEHPTKDFVIINYATTSCITLKNDVCTFIWSNLTIELDYRKGNTRGAKGIDFKVVELVCSSVYLK